LKRTTQKNHTDDDALLKEKLLQWAQNQETVLWLDSNGHEDAHSNFDGLLAVGEVSALRCTDTDKAFDKLAAYQSEIQDWIFGYFSYDLKNDLEDLISQNGDQLEFPALYFFQPQKIITIRGNTHTNVCTRSGKSISYRLSSD
jgi:para-aminobenzoate synthetase component 1